MINVDQSIVFATNIRITVVGAGGTGSHVLTNLARLTKTINMLSDEEDTQREIHVTAFDHDTVSQSNTARQTFFDCDVGENKARTIINRINMAYGLDWTGRDEKFVNDMNHLTHIIISCVDNAEARKEIKKTAKEKKIYAIDCGNDQRFAQVLVGCALHKELPLPYVEYPKLLNKEKDAGPSCSTEEALRKQDLLINQITALYAVEVVWEMLRTGTITKRGYFINLETGTTSSVKV